MQTSPALAGLVFRSKIVFTFHIIRSHTECRSMINLLCKINTVRYADAVENFTDMPTVVSVTYCVSKEKRWSASADHLILFTFFVYKDFVLGVISRKRNDIIYECKSKEKAVDDGYSQYNIFIHIRQHDHSD